MLQGYRARYLAKGTVASLAGTGANAFYDPTRQEPEGEWDRIDSWLKFTSGAASGTIRRVTGYSGPSVSAINYAQTITSGTPTVGDSYALFKTFHPTEVTLAINAARRDSFPERIVQTVATLAEVAPTAGNPTYRYAIPSGAANTVTKLAVVQRSVWTANSPLYWQTLIPTRDYNVLSDPTDGTLVYVANYTPSDGYLLRFVGEGPPVDLVNDSDTTDEPEHLIILGARMFLALQDGDQTTAQLWRAEYEKAKLDYSKRPPEVRTLAYPKIYIGTGVPRISGTY